MASDLPRLSAIPLAAWEREGVAAALKGAGLPADDVSAPGPLFWRFELSDLTPAGFGGLEIHGTDALLRSVLIVPPLRGRGIAHAIVNALEAEARIAGCRTMWLITTTAAQMFRRLGYTVCDRKNMPEPIRATSLAAACPASATCMTKPLE